MVSELRRRVDRLEREQHPVDRPILIVYENDPLGRPAPTPEELADPDADIIRIVYVKDWPPAATATPPDTRILPQSDG
jgi:hypothetical protein